MFRRLRRIITRVGRLIYLIRLREIRAYIAVSISITTTIRYAIANVVLGTIIVIGV